jgi:hypothetical protein
VCGVLQKQSSSAGAMTLVPGTVTASDTLNLRARGQSEQI